MKTILLSILLVFTTNIFSQSTDILYIPDQKSLIATYRGYSPLGFYVGGYMKTTFPQPYIYTTPLTIINRVGININNGNTISLMGGFFIESYVDSLSVKPDIWIKINPLRTLLKTSNGYDFSIGLNYMKKFRYALGISIPLGGIYQR